MGMTTGQKALVENILVSAGKRADLNAMVKFLTGDIKFACTPVSATQAATSAGWYKDIVISLVTADGEVHTSFQNTIAVSVAKVSTAGTVTVSTATPTMVDGVCTVRVTGSATAWVAADTATLTVTAATVLGYTVAAKTCVITIV